MELIMADEQQTLTEQQLARMEQWINLSEMAGGKKETAKCVTCGLIVESIRVDNKAIFESPEVSCAGTKCKWVAHSISFV